jgi:DNA-binding beta-propeller fold protein YncE
MLVRCFLETSALGAGAEMISAWDIRKFSFASPFGVALNSAGEILMTDTGNHAIRKVVVKRVKHWEVEHLKAQAHFGGIPFKSPAGIAAGTSGIFYVSDKELHKIVKMRDVPNEFSRLTDWGSEGTGPGEFRSPSGVALDKDGNVFVADTGNNRIQKFTKDGKYITQIGNGVGSADGQLNAPQGVAVDKDGYVYVVDTGNNRIQRFRLETVETPAH